MMLAATDWPRTPAREVDAVDHTVDVGVPQEHKVLRHVEVDDQHPEESDLSGQYAFDQLDIARFTPLSKRPSENAKK